MTKKDCDIRVGTSGWHYDHWVGRFYPEDLPKDKWLEFYAKRFDTVEINNTFYHLPKPQTFQKWHETTPKGFLCAVKANRYITHIKKLKDTAAEIGRFFDAARLLGGKLGPVLYQLPPGLHKDLDRLGDFVRLLPKDKTAVFEFRHDSWYEDETFDLMNRFGVGFCVHDLAGKESPKVVTGDVVYVRFHGTTGRYSGCYSKAQLHSWAKWLKAQAPKVRTIYAYFNNDISGHAVRNARTLMNELAV